MKVLKYWGALLLSMVCVVLPVGGLFLAAYFRSLIAIAVGIVMAMIGLFLNKYATEMRQSTRHEVEYDEFGRSKKKGTYDSLSKAERNAIDLQRTADMERVMNTAEMKKHIKSGSNWPQTEMDQLIGLEPVKQKMQEMVARMEFDSHNQIGRNASRLFGKKKQEQEPENSISGRHMVFYGSPGTGKTTVARILTGFLFKYGYIKENKCVEVDGNFLKAGADTALKTELTVRQAFDGVLFVDEAYTLMDDPYAGKEAISALIKQMEDHRNRFILILAGYTNEMKFLIDQNPGFRSRIKEYLIFPDYNNQEMKEIFVTMAENQHFTVSEDALEAFDERISKERRRTTFGNARTARNILDETIDKHALNYKIGLVEKKDRYRIRGVDINRDVKLNSV